MKSNTTQVSRNK